MTAESLMKRFSMAEHPENGAFVEKHYLHTGRGRPASGMIYYYVAAGERTEFHVIDCDEYWCHNAGADLEVWSFTPDGTLRKQILGTSAQAEPFAFFRRGEIFASRLPESSPDGALITCITVPRFDYRGFRLIGREEVLKLDPGLHAFYESVE